MWSAYRTKEFPPFFFLRLLRCGLYKSCLLKELLTWLDLRCVREGAPSTAPSSRALSPLAPRKQVRGKREESLLVPLFLPRWRFPPMGAQRPRTEAPSARAFLNYKSVERQTEEEGRWQRIFFVDSDHILGISLLFDLCGTCSNFERHDKTKYVFCHSALFAFPQSLYSSSHKVRAEQEALWAVTRDALDILCSSQQQNNPPFLVP